MNFLLEAQPQDQNILLGLAPLIIIAVLFYVLFIMPQRKEQKNREAMIQALKPGDKVITSGGLHGTVTDLKEETLILKIADSTKVELSKFAVIKALDKESSR